MEGDSIEIQVNVTDAVQGKPIMSPNAVLGIRNAQGALVERLAQQVIGSLSVSFDERLVGAVDVMGNAPSLEAYQAFDAGMRLYYGGEWVEAVQQFLRAAEIDSTFLTSLIYATYAASNDASARSVYDSLRTSLYERRNELSPYDAYMVESLWAAHQGDYAGWIAALARAVEIAPGSKAAYNYARALAYANRPHAAVEVLTTSLYPEKGAMRGFEYYWGMLALAYHLAGEHDRELEVAQQGRALYPSSIDLVESEAEALAAMGRVDEILTLLDQSATFEPGYEGSPGTVMRDVGLALAAHGFEDGARRVFERAIQWFESRSPSATATDANRSGLAYALYLAGRLQDAKVQYESLASASPRAPNYQVALGLIAARQGDRAEANRISQWLTTLESPSYRVRSLWRGLIAEALGNRDQAVTFLREFFTDAGFEFSHIYVPSLRGNPPFEEMMRPKG